MNYFGLFGKTESDAFSLLDGIVERAIQFHQTGDFEGYAKIITPKLASKLSAIKFKQAHQTIAPQLGEFLSKEFLGTLNRSNNPMLVYRAKYANTEDDILINVTFENDTNPPLIDWMWIE